MDNKSLQAFIDLASEVNELGSDQLLSHFLNYLQKDFTKYRIYIALLAKEKAGFDLLDVRNDINQLNTVLFIPFQDTVLTKIVRGNKPAYRSDISREKTKYTVDLAHIQAGVKSDFIVPLMAGNACLGSLNITSNEKNGIRSADRQFFRLLAFRIALAIQNSQLSEKMDNLVELFVGRTTELFDTNNKLITEIEKNKQANNNIEALSVFPEMDPAPVLKVDTNGKIILCNTAARTLFSVKKIVGKSWKEVCPESCKSKCFILSDSSREYCQHESSIADKHFLFTCKKAPESEFIYIFGADITLRRQAEKLLRNANDSLEEKVAERTAELTIAKEELQRALLQVEQLKTQFEAENLYLQEEIRLNHNFEEIIGQSNPLKNVLSKVELVAATDATVLILGETGTGKELFARAIHDLSPRNYRPLVKVNCAALQPTLIESELFGHEKGSFTGAFTKRAGRFELANNGAIFLDEIGDLTIGLQTKLLRVIQEKEFERLGGSKTIKVDVRVIAATHKDLEEEVTAGRFREDLYYRLNVFPISLPSLRQRREDIPILAQFFVNKYGNAMRKKITNIPQKIMDTLNNHQWLGNVRELENIIERAVILTTGDTLQLDTSLLHVHSGKASSADEPTMTLDELQRDHIRGILQKTNWQIEGQQGAATILGINASTLRSRIQKLGIPRP